MAEAQTANARKASIPEVLRRPVSALQTTVETLETGARGRLGELLETSQTGLHDLDVFLERVSREDWTVAGLRRRLLDLRRQAETAGNTALRRMDEMPAVAVTAIAAVGRARVQDLSRGLQAIAKRIEPPPPPAERPANGA